MGMLADNILLPLAHTYTLGAPTDIYIYVMKFYFHYLLLPENMEIVQNKFNTDVLRKIMFAVHYLPKDMPNYWKTIKEFATMKHLPLTRSYCNKYAKIQLEFPSIFPRIIAVLVVQSLPLEEIDLGS